MTRRLWIATSHPNYVQHNPVIPNGAAAIAGLIPTLKNLSYEIGMVVAEGDLVMVHGRYVGWGPKPLVAVDIFKVKDGKVVEHWDVMQEEVPADTDGERQSDVLACVRDPRSLDFMEKTTQQRNKDIVLEAFDTLFNKRDYAKAETFWSPKYIQHSAHIEPGREGLFNLIKSIPATLKYEPGLIVAEGDFVILHGRFSGMGLPVNWIAADILRIENGILVEHWDVIQDEATKEQSKSKLPMFGSSFPVYAKPENTIG